MTYKEVLKEITTVEYVMDRDLCLAIKEALSKRIPKRGKRKNSFTDVCECGKSIYPHMEYCSGCGQRLDWSEEK